MTYLLSSKLEYGIIVLEPAIVGEPVYLLSYNMGKVSLTNLMMKAEGFDTRIQLLRR